MSDTRVPQWLQKAALVPGALLGRALGFQPTYEAAGSATPALA